MNQVFRHPPKLHLLFYFFTAHLMIFWATSARAWCLYVTLLILYFGSRLYVDLQEKLLAQKAYKLMCSETGLDLHM